MLPPTPRPAPPHRLCLCVARSAENPAFNLSRTSRPGRPGRFNLFNVTVLLRALRTPLYAWGGLGPARPGTAASGPSGSLGFAWLCLALLGSSGQRAGRPPPSVHAGLAGGAGRGLRPRRITYRCLRATTGYLLPRPSYFRKCAHELRGFWEKNKAFVARRYQHVEPPGLTPRNQRVAIKCSRVKSRFFSHLLSYTCNI